MISKLLQNPKFVPTPPTHARNRRPDLVPDGAVGNWDDRGKAPGESVRPRAQPGKKQPKQSYLSKLLVGWIGAWIDLPVLGYWHEDAPHSITTSETGDYVVKYKAAGRGRRRSADKQGPDKASNS